MEEVKDDAVETPETTEEVEEGAPETVEKTESEE